MKVLVSLSALKNKGGNAGPLKLQYLELTGEMPRLGLLTKWGAVKRVLRAALWLWLSGVRMA
jgi:hypothetical protein